jgi:hypothetical protein
VTLQQEVTMYDGEGSTSRCDRLRNISSQERSPLQPASNRPSNPNLGRVLSDNVQLDGAGRPQV